MGRRLTMSVTVDEVTLRLPALPESVPAARSRTRRFARLPPTREDALALLVTELIAGMVRAGPPTPERVVELRLVNEEDGIRLSVRRTDHVVAPVAADPGRGHPLALRLLDRLSDDWGDNEDGTRWVRLRTHVGV
jgi:hypothetical protein